MFKRIKRKKLRRFKINFHLISKWIAFYLFLLISLIAYQNYNLSLEVKQKIQIAEKLQKMPTPTWVPTPTSEPTPTKIPVYASSKTLTPTPIPTWGVANKISEHTYTMKIGMDTSMASPQEILQALNTYRQQHGQGTLSWDNDLANYAQSRAEYFKTTGQLDSHAGFNQYVSNPANIIQGDKNFHGMGENSSIGFKMSGVHLIEWVFASDEGHDKNQLNSSWTHVGIGVSDTAVDFIFAG